MERERDFGLRRALYSIEETGELLSLGRTTIYSLINDKRLPASKIGRKTVIPATGIAQFLSSLAQPPSINSSEA